jgi:hypothetical protein
MAQFSPLVVGGGARCGRFVGFIDLTLGHRSKLDSRLDLNLTQKNRGLKSRLIPLGATMLIRLGATMLICQLGP